MKIFYILTICVTVFFAVLAYMENMSPEVGLAALESLGHFVLYASIALLGVIILIVAAIASFFIKRRKKSIRKGE